MPNSWPAFWTRWPPTQRPSTDRSARRHGSTGDQVQCHLCLLLSRLSPTAPPAATAERAESADLGRLRLKRPGLEMDSESADLCLPPIVCYASIQGGYILASSSAFLAENSSSVRIPAACRSDKDLICSGMEVGITCGLTAVPEP